MNTINLQGSPRVKHQIIGTMRPKVVLKGYLRMPTLTKLEQRKTLNAIENGSYEVLPDENRTLSSVSVNVDVPIPEGYIDPEGTAIITSNGIHDITHYEFARVDIPERKEEQEKTVEITKNGTNEILPDGDKVLSKATVDVNVPIPDGYIKPEGSMDITENGTFDVREKAEVNVQFVAKPEKPYIDSRQLKNGNYMFRDSYGTDLSMLEFLDSSNFITAKYFLYNRRELVTPPNHLSFENCENLEWAFNNCRGMTGTLKLNAPKNTTLFSAFAYTQNITEIDLGDTSNAEQWAGAFTGSSVETISELDFSGVTNTSSLQNLFNSASKLKNVTFKSIPITSNQFTVQYSTQLTVESLLSLLNALSDNSELTTTYIVHLGSANLAKLTQEQKEIAYNKNIDLD